MSTWLVQGTLDSFVDQFLELFLRRFAFDPITFTGQINFAFPGVLDDHSHFHVPYVHCDVDARGEFVRLKNEIQAILKGRERKRAAGAARTRERNGTIELWVAWSDRPIGHLS